MASFWLPHSTFPSRIEERELAGPKNSTSEIGTGEQAKQEAKQMLVSQSEFFGSLAFLLLFGQCKK